MTHLLRSVVVSLVVANALHAQFGAGVYYPRGPAVGVWTGPAFGYVPGAYGSFWSNGFSLYGPPVPTYGTVPGFFGGNDQRLSNFPDLRYTWFGPWGWRGGYVPLDAPPRPVRWCPPAACEIRLPADDAEVLVNGTRLEASGAVRRFLAAIPPGVGASHEIEARWATADSIGSARRTVILRAGEFVIADFVTPPAD